MRKAADEFAVFLYCLVGGLMIVVPTFSIAYTCRAVIKKIRVCSR